MEEIKNTFIRSVRPSCPKCDTPSLIGELHTKEDGSKTTICAYCGAYVRISLKVKDAGVHVQTVEVVN